MFKSSETTVSVYTALLSVQSQLETVKKTGVNAHIKSRYATLSDVLSLVRPALNAQGLFLMQYVSESSDAVYTRIVHASSGEWVEVSVSIQVDQGAKNVMQAIGSCMTYGCRYGLSALLGLAAVEDDDGEAAGQKREKQKTKLSGDFRLLVERMSVDESRELYAKLKEEGTEEARAKMAVIYEIKSQSK